MTNEKLIEEAAKAIAAFTDPVAWTQFRGEAGAALAVFEKALGEATVTPTAHEVTTDEREALACVILGIPQMALNRWHRPQGDALDLADRLIAAGCCFRHSEVPGPSAEVDDPGGRLFRSRTYKALAERDFTGHMDEGRRTAFYEGWNARVQWEALRAGPQGEPSDDERAVSAAIEMASTVYGDYDDAQGALSDIHMLLAPFDAGFRRSESSKPGEHGGTIPLYGMLDVWMALYGTSHPEFDEFYAEHGYADTWARILDVVRRRRSEVPEPSAPHDDLHDDEVPEPSAALSAIERAKAFLTDVSETNEMRNRNAYGALKSIATEAQGEPSDAQVRAAVLAWRSMGGGRLGWSSMRVALRAALRAAEPRRGASDAHDEDCESEYVMGVAGYTDCGCRERASEAGYRKAVSAGAAAIAAIVDDHDMPWNPEVLADAALRAAGVGGVQ